MRRFWEVKDPVEIIYGHEVINNFPNYAVFWEKFYGFREDIFKTKQDSRPYGLIFNKEVDKNKIDIYKKINLTYHHLFYSLASMHHHLKRYSKHNRQKTIHSFIRDDSFRCFYFNLSVCRDMLNNIIGLILHDGLKELEPDENKHFIIPFCDKSSDELIYSEDIKKWSTYVSNIRARLVHLSSIGKFVEIKKSDTGRVEDNLVIETIPKNIIKDNHWYDDHKNIEKEGGVNVYLVLDSDLYYAKFIFNEIFKILIKKYEDYLRVNSINIDYNGKIPLDEYKKYYY